MAPSNYHELQEFKRPGRKQTSRDSEGPVLRVRGRPPGKNRIPLTLEERRARNAFYERERRKKAKEAKLALANRSQAPHTVPHQAVMESAKHLLSRLKSELKSQQQEIAALREKSQLIPQYGNSSMHKSPLSNTTIEALPVGCDIGAILQDVPDCFPDLGSLCLEGILTPETSDPQSPFHQNSDNEVVGLDFCTAFPADCQQSNAVSHNIQGNQEDISTISLVPSGIQSPNSISSQSPLGESNHSFTDSSLEHNIQESVIWPDLSLISLDAVVPSELTDIAGFDIDSLLTKNHTQDVIDDWLPHQVLKEFINF